MRVVYFSSDINGSGIEIQTFEGLIPIEPSELGLSQGLCSHILWRQRWFDCVFNLATDHVERFRLLGPGFDEIGKQLADRSQQELGAEWQVMYEPQGGWRLDRPDDSVRAIPCAPRAEQ